MAKEQRFERAYTQGALQITEIWVDKETGVNYLFHASGQCGRPDAAARPRRQAGRLPAAEPLMRYFIPASERQGSCYFEFQPGAGAGGSGCPAPSCLQTSGGRHCA